MTRFYTPVDLTGNELRNVRAQNLGTPPDDPVLGQFYFDSSSRKLRYWNGDEWRDATSATGTVTEVSAVEPITSSGGTTPEIGIEDATTSARGAMSADDKAKLDDLDGDNYVKRDGSEPAFIEHVVLRQWQHDGKTYEAHLHHENYSYIAITLYEDGDYRSSLHLGADGSYYGLSNSFGTYVGAYEDMVELGGGSVRLGGAVTGTGADALRDRSTHTGTQPVSSVDGLQGALDDLQDTLDDKADDSDLQAHVDASNPHSGSASTADLDTHIGDTSNPHNVTASQIDAIPTSQKGASGGVAELDGNGYVPSSQLPPMAIGETFPVSSESEMLALDAHIGDVAVRSDTDSKWLLVGDDPSVLGNWHELGTATDVVESVSGGTGIDTVGTANVTVSLDSATQSTLADVANKADQSALATHVNDESNPHGVTAAQVGADSAGTASSAVNAHESASNPHPQYIQKYATTINDPDATETVSHGLGTQDVVVRTYLDGEEVYMGVEITGANTVTLRAAQSISGSLRVVVIG